MKKEKFKLTGLQYYIKSVIKKLGIKNSYYEYSKTELKEAYQYDDYINEYDFAFKDIQIIPEPDNPHDPKAIKVLADDTQVGYIKKGSTSRVRNLLNDPDLSYYSLDIKGGKYKHVYEDENGKIQVETGESEYYADLYICLNEPQQSEPESKIEPSTPKRSFFDLLRR